MDGACSRVLLCSWLSANVPVRCAASSSAALCTRDSSGGLISGILPLHKTESSARDVVCCSAGLAVTCWQVSCLGA